MKGAQDEQVDWWQHPVMLPGDFSSGSYFYVVFLFHGLQQYQRFICSASPLHVTVRLSFLIMQIPPLFMALCCWVFRVFSIHLPCSHQVDELYEAYCIQRRLCDGASKMKQAFAMSPASKAARESLTEINRSYKEYTEVHPLRFSLRLSHCLKAVGTLPLISGRTSPR